MSKKNRIRCNSIECGKTSVTFYRVKVSVGNESVYLNRSFCAKHDPVERGFLSPGNSRIPGNMISHYEKETKEEFLTRQILES
jgi:hypothetical protein